MPTPHISAAPGDFADVCLMPGDPARARWVAESFLEDAVQVNAIRNMEGYTGSYQGKRVSVMGSGMGMPSLLIYATELIKEYGVTSLIRIGSCGGIQEDLQLMDLIIATGASTDSAVNRRRFAELDFAAVADFDLTRRLVDSATAHGVQARIGPILSSDHFYQPRPEIFDLARDLGLLAVEMEAAALFGVAAEHGVKAATILTVVDIIGRKENVHPDDREASLTEMAKIALDAAIAGD